MKTVAFVIGLCIAVFAVVGLLVPSTMVWIARRFTRDTPTVWYAIAVGRLAFGVLLLSVARNSRAPKTLRVVAFIPIAAALAIPVIGVERGRAMIELWTSQGSGLVRLSALPLLALGGFVAYACAPARRQT